MKINTFFILFNSCVFCFGCHAQKPLAFPGAEGFGKYATGGRGGKVILVTNLDDDGPGSFREAVKNKLARTILFTVSGTIALESPITISKGNLTIAGQSAPGDGICIRNFPVSIQADNVIVRFLRFRLGDEKKQQADALSGNKGKSDIIIDHCSMSWATDECASFYGNKNFTLQWCIVAESLNHSVHEKGDHGYGGIWGGHGASFHHNLIASHSSRLPRFSGSETTPNSPDELVDFRNNVIYNWVNNSSYGGERGRYNIIGNYYMEGPATKKAKNQFVNPWSPYGKFFVKNNLYKGNEEISADNTKGVKADYPDSALVTKPFLVESINEQEPNEAFNLVLNNAGASFRRDAVDERIVTQIKTGSLLPGKNKNGIIDSQAEVGGWPILKLTTPPKDSDLDGMPDEWELRHKLNPTDGSDAIKKDLDQEFDNLEVYLNSLVTGVVK